MTPRYLTLTLIDDLDPGNIVEKWGLNASAKGISQCQAALMGP